MLGECKPNSWDLIDDLMRLELVERAKGPGEPLYRITTTGLAALKLGTI